MLSTTVQISLFFGNVVPLILIDLILNIFNVNEMISFFFLDDFDSKNYICSYGNR